MQRDVLSGDCLADRQRHMSEWTDVQSPTLTPYNYQVIGPLKETLNGKKFSTKDDIKGAGSSWMTAQPVRRLFFPLGESRH